jgi:hypothetical protein
MSDRESEWHKLEVGYYWPREETTEDGGYWKWSELKRDPVPEDVDPDELDWEYEFTHPAECGHGCFSCGTHQTCGIDYDVAQIGIVDALGGSHLQPGLYAARHHLDVHRTQDGAEVSSWIECLPTKPDDSRFVGLP